MSTLPLFDFIATLSTYIINSKYISVSHAKINSLPTLCDDIIRYFFHELETIANSGKQKDLAAYTRTGIPQHLAQKITDNPDFVGNQAAVIIFLDKLVKKCISKESLYSYMKEGAKRQEIKILPSVCNNQIYTHQCFSSLNSAQSVETTHIRIIPHFYPYGYESSLPNSNDKENTDSRRISHLDFHWITIIHESDLHVKEFGKIEVVNVITETQLAKDNKDDLRIVVSPMLNDFNLKKTVDLSDPIPADDGHISYFSMKPAYSSPSKESPKFDTENCVEKVVDKSVSFNADIIVFPEMLGTCRMMNHRYVLFPTVKNSQISLLVLPSICIEKRNISLGLDRHLNVVTPQSKQLPFIYLPDKPKAGEQVPSFVEDLKSFDRTVYIYHILGIGSIVIAICRDFLSEDYLNFLTDILHVSFIICPSWTEKTQDFINHAEQARSRGAYVLFINCCSARPPSQGVNNHYVGLLATPWEQDPSQNSVCYLQTDCQGSCCTPDKPCYFEIAIHPTFSINYSHKHI